MRRLFLLTLIASLVSGCSKRDQRPKDRGPSDEQLKRLISEAASMPIEHFRKLAEAAGVPALDAVQSKPLTLLLVSGRFGSPGDEAALREIRVVGIPRPAELARAMVRGQDADEAPYASFLWPENITAVTREARGDTITGAVSFREKGLYEGTVEYTARRRADGWRVEEFRLPASGYRTTRMPAGTWKLADEKPHLHLAIETPRVRRSKDDDTPVPSRVVAACPLIGGRDADVVLDDTLGPPIRIILRPEGSDRAGCRYELSGHPHLLRASRDLLGPLQRLAKATAGRPLPIISARADVRWQHVVEAARAAR